MTRSDTSSFREERGRTAACERMRRAISLRLDGELSPVGERRLLRHLGGCEDCASFAISLATVTLALRSG